MIATAEDLRTRYFNDRDQRWHTPHAKGALAVSMCTHSDPRFYLHSVVVEREHRGQGHGRRLMEVLIAYANQCGVGLELRVRANNIPAIRLYLSLGFVTVPTNAPQPCGRPSLFMIRPNQKEN